MRSSLLLVATGAALALAGPIRVDKRDMKTDWVYQVVTVTVTGDNTKPTEGVFVGEPATTVAPKPTPAPAPASPVTTVIVPVKAKPAPVKAKLSPPKAKPAPVKAKPAPPKAKPAPPTKAPVSSSPVLNDYESTMVNQHNIHRSNHSAPAISWNSTLADWAAITAKSCVFKHDMNEGTGFYGQNLAAEGSSGNISGEKVKNGASGVTGSWYNSEMENWEWYGDKNPPSGTNLDAWGHFTQVVWKGSEEVGCATVECPSGTIFGMNSWYTVCNYQPAGNMGGAYGENVGRPQGAAIASP